jgi:hypothetical protein
MFLKNDGSELGCWASSFNGHSQLGVGSFSATTIMAHPYWFSKKDHDRLHMGKTKTH